VIAAADPSPSADAPGIAAYLRSLGSRAATALGYHAVDQTGKRKPPHPRLESEDDTLTIAGRRKVITSARDLVRNFTIAAWMIRKHLDYVCEASFHSRTGDDKFDLECEQLVRWWSGRLNFDVSGRFGFHKFIRMAEARKLQKELGG
jgi:hypothetical protein